MRQLAALLGLLWLAAYPSARAQEKAAPPVPPTAGARLEFLDEVSYYQQRYLRLADVMPAEKYSWRPPSEGVRTVGEVYMHIVAANYSYAKMLGTPPPAGIDVKTLMASSGDKAKVIQALKDSFTYFENAILAVKDSELEKEIRTSRGQMTIRGSFFVMTGHFGEHLGQSIAYARMNGIVPPWTEERQKQEGEKPKP